MKYVPSAIKGNVNVSKVSHTRDFITLTLGIAVILVGLYAAAGWAVTAAVDYIPEDALEFISEEFRDEYASHDSTEGELWFQELAAGLDGTGQQYRFVIVNSPDANAMALPGNVILIFSELIKEAQSENELAFVVAHEIGHFRNRDHLRGFGRMIVLVAISSVTFGSQSSATSFLTEMLVGVEMRFSQAQELAADRLGLELLNTRYGHVGGAGDFFERVLSWGESGRVKSFFSSHPYPGDRKDALMRLSAEKGYSLDKVIPLDDVRMEFLLPLGG